MTAARDAYCASCGEPIELGVYRCGACGRVCCSPRCVQSHKAARYYQTPSGHDRTTRSRVVCPEEVPPG